MKKIVSKKIQNFGHSFPPKSQCKSIGKKDGSGSQSFLPRILAMPSPPPLLDQQHTQKCGHNNMVFPDRSRTEGNCLHLQILATSSKTALHGQPFSRVRQHVHCYVRDEEGTLPRQFWPIHIIFCSRAQCQPLQNFRKPSFSNH